METWSKTDLNGALPGSFAGRGLRAGGGLHPSATPARLARFVEYARRMSVAGPTCDREAWAGIVEQCERWWLVRERFAQGALPGVAA